MELLALFTPEDDAAETWRLRLFPLPLPVDVPGLDQGGEVVALSMPDYASLDRLMLQRRAGYRKRLHASGVTEITASTPPAARALCEWVASLIATSRKP